MTKEAIEALEAARAHILDAYRIWQADDVSAVPPPKSGAGAVISKIDAVLSSLPIAVEGKVKALEWRLNEEGWQIADTFFGGYRVERNPHDHWCWGVFFHGEKGVGLNPADNFEAAKAASQADFNERISSALDAKQAPDFRDMIIIGDTAYPVHSEVCRAFNELSAALVVGEPVAWTTQAQIDKFKVDPGCNAVMWGEPLPHHPDIPLYAAPSAPDGWQPIETAPHACHVIACYFYECEWIYDVVLSPPSPPFTHWKILPASPALGGAK